MAYSGNYNNTLNSQSLFKEQRELLMLSEFVWTSTLTQALVVTPPSHFLRGVVTSKDLPEIWLFTRV